MKFKILLSLLTSLTIVSLVFGQAAKVAASQDTIVIAGGTFAGGENAGNLETIINSDTAASGARVNPNRVYQLNGGQFYYQLSPINVTNPTGVLTIVGVPSSSGTTKPVILMQPTAGVDVGINVLYGSLKIVNVHWQVMQMDGNINNELFFCGTENKAPQSLTVDNCLFEFSNIDLFDCTNEPGAIGGWPYGAKIRITNSYFRNMFFAGQWWGSRVFQCKHPIDTTWVENNTVTTGGLTFLMQNQITAFAYYNHNTIINNKKYWVLSPYFINCIMTNNIFVNQDWVGEDSNVTNSGQDPDKLFESTINIDTNNATNGLVTQQRYYLGDSTHFVPLLSLQNERVYISNNVNFYDPQLISGYYQSSKYINAQVGTIPSYLTWFYAYTPHPINNTPGMWMNSRTAALFQAYSPAKGGSFIEENTTTADPKLQTPAIADASVVDAMAQWNQNQWGDPLYTTPTPVLTTTKYIYGDYDPTTIPGKGGESSTGGGITKFTDLQENFSQSTVISKLDGLPVGSLIWNDALNAAYSSSEDWGKVNAGFLAAGGKEFDVTAVNEVAALPNSYSLSQNYPNPFNPSTTINFSLEKTSNVTLTVYNILGQKVATLINNVVSAGQHSIQFDASKLASGVYVYRIDAGNFTMAKKMILMK